MIKLFVKLFYKLKKYLISLSILIKNSNPKHTYRVLSIENDNNENYTAIIQVINKKQIFRVQPEEILADDNLVNLFSQKDVRALTYLGYLGINSPRYSILAKRLSENDSKLIFAIKERKNNKLMIKSADEISSDKNLLTGLNQQDAHMVGFTVATEQATQEKLQKERLITIQDTA